MSKRCQVTNKKTAVGKSYTIRGLAKKKKGIGLKITGITKRKFLPNLFTKRLWFAEENRFVRLKLSAHGLRSVDKKGVGAVVREMRAKGQKI